MQAYLISKYILCYAIKMSTDQRTIDWYNKHADDYFRHVRTPDESVYHSLYEKPAMYAELPDLTGKSVISLGCGSGEDSNYLKNKGALRSVGIDISEKLIEKAKEEHPICEFRVMDMENLDFDDAIFDFAYSSLAIHYIGDWSNVFSEVFRILKPNTYFLFSCGHPIDSALQITTNDDTQRKKQLGIVSDKITNSIEIYGDYLNSKMLDELNSGFEVTTYHKPLSEISAEAASAGFLIQSLLEPRPLEKMKEISPNDYKRLSKIPYFVIFKLLKPS